MKKPSIGAMRHYLTIERQVQGAVDGFGAPAITWTTHAHTWGSIEGAHTPINRAEQLTAANALLATFAAFLMRCRYVAGVDTSMRVKKESSGEYYNIVDVTDVDERHVVLELTCKQVTV